MAGYIGSKAVNLSTTGADINGDANIDGTLTVDSNVGIGTSSPDAEITVVGDAHLKATSGYSSLYFNGVTTASSRFAAIKKNYDSPFDLSINASNSSSGAPIVFNSSSALEAMRIDSSGNVGIGFSNPDAYITDNSSLVVEGQLRVQGVTNTAAVPVIGVRDDNTGFYLPATNTLGITTNGSEAMRIDSSGNLLVGTTSNSDNRKFRVYGTAEIDGAGIGFLRFKSSGTSIGSVGQGNYVVSGGPSAGFGMQSQAELVFGSGGANERMRIDSSGNLLVGRTSNNWTTAAGFTVQSNGAIIASRADASGFFNRLSTYGDIMQFAKDGTTVGGISAQGSGMVFYSSSIYTGIGGSATNPYYWLYNSAIYPTVDNSRDLGTVGNRFDDVYATNGTIQTSDRNEKQDIAELSDAEQRVAVAAKGLLRKFRWRDAVTEKGDEARTHFGIIAQDLQAAFAAEGLDAGDYAMFISTTWWETQTEVPAVEAVAEVLDEEGNVVTEAVEAVDAYTRTDTYETQEEAPEGATERTRLGVRYSELLAFIIGAL